MQRGFCLTIPLVLQLSNLDKIPGKWLCIIYTVSLFFLESHCLEFIISLSLVKQARNGGGEDRWHDWTKFIEFEI